MEVAAHWLCRPELALRLVPALVNVYIFAEYVEWFDSMMFNAYHET